MLKILGKTFGILLVCLSILSFTGCSELEELYSDSDSNSDEYSATWVEYLGHAISGNNTGADRLYFTDTNATNANEFVTFCKSYCEDGSGDHESNICGAFVVNFPSDSYYDNYCVFKLQGSVPYSNADKNSYVLE